VEVESVNELLPAENPRVDEIFTVDATCQPNKSNNMQVAPKT
jgi:hypothetical protein